MRISNEAKQELTRLEVANGNVLLPNQVVEAATDPSNPLHGYFNWNNASAAAEQRINRARDIIRSVTVTETRRPVNLELPKYIHNPAGRHSAGYVQTTSVLESEQRNIVMEREMAMLAGMIARIRSLSVQYEMEDAIRARMLAMIG